MNLRQLTCFVATAEERHLGRAAERLCLSQPPLTRHIQSLEDDLGVELFTRTSRGMTLTQAGEELLHDARNGLAGVRALPARRARHRGGTGGPRALAAGRGRGAPAGRVRGGARQRPAWRAADHRLVTDHGGGHGRPLPAATVDLCRRHGFEPMFAPAASDVVMSTALAAIGCGVSLVPASMARVQIPGIVHRPLNAQAEAWMDLHCFYLRKPKSPLLQALLNSIRTFREAGPAAF